MKKAVRSLLNRTMQHFGYELRLIDSPPVGYSRFLEKSKHHFPYPNTIFDIGVGQGTPWLYDAFPRSHLVLVEPLPHFASDIAEIEASRPCSVFKLALGSDQTEAKIYIPRDCPTGSSLYLDRDFIEDDAVGEVFDELHEVLIVRKTTLDAISNFAGPFVIKIDAEGSELEILRGALETLKQTSMLVLEISVKDRYQGEATFDQILLFLRENGFRLFDIIAMAYGGATKFLHHIDVVFVSEAVLKEN